MKFTVNVRRDAENFDEKSISMEVYGKELDEVLNAAKAILMYADVNASVFIKRIKE